VTRGIQQIEAQLVSVWEAYYLTPSANDLEALASTPALLAEWISSLGSRMAFAYPQSAEEWLDSGKSFALVLLLVVALGWLGLRGGAALPGHWSKACENVIKKSWRFTGLGLAVLAASSDSYGGIYFSFVLCGVLLIIGGIAAMSWRLRIAVAPFLKNEPSPLFRLYVPSAIGVLMLFSDLPTRILGIVWGVVMLAALAWIIYVNRGLKTQQTLPWLERLTYSLAFWFAIASLGVNLAGYARLAILLFMVLFALANTFTLCNALMKLLEILVDLMFSKSTQPVSNAVAQAVSVPVSWVLSLVCTVPWIWAVPGARYLLAHAMSANYTVGEASFDFSKLLIIVLLFFLFRSFISLGRASLEHLPERVPNIERGVIPPLGNMLTYGLWALFAIIALGMLGVNFTSLAVVAGGLSVGIGFGMQNIFNNLISGLMLIFGRTLLVGDYVEVGAAAGTVRAISIRSTTLETPERALIYVPNSIIMAGQFTNWTRNSRLVRRSVVIGVSYDSDTEKVKSIMLSVAQKHDHVLQAPPPAVLLSNFGDNALEFTLNVFIDDFDYALSTLSALRFDLEREFRDNTIDIPFPQLTLHMDSPGAPEPEKGLS
jgi:small-conductance mechanosensitive channel